MKNKTKYVLLLLLVCLSINSNKIYAAPSENLGSGSYEYSGGDAAMSSTQMPLISGSPQRVPSVRNVEITNSVYLRTSSTNYSYYMKREYYLSPTTNYLDGNLVATFNGSRHGVRTDYIETPVDIVNLTDPINSYIIVRYTLVPDSYSKNTHIITTATSSFSYRDVSPPTPPVTNSMGAWTTDPSVNIIFAGNSATGIDHHDYNLDYSGWQRYYPGLKLEDGVHQILFRSVDVEGRYSDIISDGFYIDNMIPPLPLVKGMSDNWVNSNVRLTISANGSVPSGNSNISHMSTGAVNYPWVSSGNSGMAIDVVNEGISNFSFRNISGSGVTGPSSNVSVKLDKTPPPIPKILIK